jgi:hypothetical protein
MFKRTSVQLVSVFAILCVCVASVAACACSHHEPSAKAEPLSCHSNSHEEPKAEATALTPTGNSIGISCECFVRAFAPAITAKNETKRLNVEGADLAENATNAPAEVRPVSITEVTAVQTKLPIVYSQFLVRSGPSRAPPRL